MTVQVEASANPQGVEVAPTAPNLRRVLAAAIDFVCVFPVVALFAIAGELVGLGLAYFVASLAGCFAMYAGLLVWLTGRTPGKAMLRLEIRRLDGSAPARTLPGLGWSLGRHSVGYVVIDVFLLGTTAALVTPRHRCLHDYAFGSDVVMAGEAGLVERWKGYEEQARAALEEKGADYGPSFELWTRVAKIVLIPAPIIAFVGVKLAENADVAALLKRLFPEPEPVAPERTRVSRSDYLSLKAKASLWAGTATITGIVVLPFIAPFGEKGPANVDVVFAEWRVNQPQTSEIYRMKADGTQRRQLTHNATRDLTPDLFGDRRIVFSSERNGNTDLYVMDADGKNELRLTTDPTNDSMPRWSDDGERVVFVSDRDGDSDIYVMDADGGDLRLVTANEIADSEPDWSPDEDRIAFVTDRDGNNDIYVMDTDGKNVRPITRNAAADGDPAWSPDGKRLAFTGDRGDNRDIYVTDADGANSRRLTGHAANDTMPLWSPDGELLLFATDRGMKGDGDEYYAVSIDGGPAWRVTRSNPS